MSFQRLKRFFLLKKKSFRVHLFAFLKHVMKIMRQNRQIQGTEAFSHFMLSFFVVFFVFWKFHRWQKPQSHLCECGGPVQILIIRSTYVLYLQSKCSFSCLHDQIYFVVRTTSGPISLVWSSNLLEIKSFIRFCDVSTFHVFILTKKRSR